MTALRRWTIAAGTLLGAAIGCRSATQSARGAAAEVRTAFARALPAMDGARLHATVLEVTYPPGGSSPPHRHPCAVVGYVLEGTLRTQVRGEPAALYHPGDSFYEPPDGVHQVSANASATEPVRFLAYFTCDSGAPLSASATDAGSGSEAVR